MIACSDLSYTLDHEYGIDLIKCLGGVPFYESEGALYRALSEVKNHCQIALNSF